jgi:hypothetical protein
MAQKSPSIRGIKYMSEYQLGFFLGQLLRLCVVGIFYAIGYILLLLGKIVAFPFKLLLRR